MAVIPYHRVVPTAESLYDKIQTMPEYESIRADADMLRSHYLARREYAHMHAALCFLVSSNHSKAIAMISDERSVSYDGARNIMLSAINAAPEKWLEDREGFYKKGLIHSGQKYYTAPAELEKGSFFDQTSRDIPPEMQPILLRALQMRLARTMTEREVSVTSRALLYVAVQLMPAGEEKNFKMNALSTERTARMHQENLGLSYDIIRIITTELERPLPADVAGEHLPRRMKQSSPQKPKALQPATREQFTSAHDVMHGFASENEAPPVSVLYKNLKYLKDCRQITPNEAVIYHYLKTPPKNLMDMEGHTENSAAIKYDRPLNVIRMIVSKVDKALAELEGRSSPLRRDLHQSGAVRP